MRFSHRLFLLLILLLTGAPILAQGDAANLLI